jgi:Concanavalin A-like lectin/glucanases superfamily
MPLIFAPSANQISSVTLSSPTGYYGSTATFIVSMQGYNNGDTIYYSTTGSGVVQSTGTITVSNYLGDLGTTNIPVTTVRTTTTSVITATFYNGSTPVTLSSGVNNASIPLATPDQFFTATVLLLSPAGPGPTSITDISATTGTVTVFGTPKVTSFIPFTTPNVSSSILFSGSGDYLSIPNSTSYSLNGGPYTIEFWVYWNVISGEQNLIERFTAASGPGWTIYNGGGGGGISLYGSSGVVNSATALVAKQWYHLAISYDGTTTRVFTNGTLDGSAVANITDAANTPLLIGVRQSGVTFFNGYMSNIRIVKGVAVYTGSFTRPTGPLQATQSANPFGGSNTAAITAGQTVLLLAASTVQPQSNNSFLDSVNTNTVITPGGTPAQGTFSPFWPYATTFNGSNQYLLANSSILDLATGAPNWTVECWFYLNNISTQQCIFWKGGATGSVNSSYSFALTNASGQWVVGDGGAGGAVVNIAASFAANTWYHFALVRNGSTITSYTNGVQSGTASAPSMSNTANDKLTLGSSVADGSTRYLNGSIANFRITKGLALYTATFTPPSISSSLPATANTVMLTCQGPAPADYSTYTNTVTSVGTAVTRPISTTTFLNSVYSTSTIGGSMYFDGTTVVSTTSTSGLHTLGSNDFTAECWFYTSTVSGNGQIIGFRTPTLSFAPFILWNASGSIVLYSSGTGGSWNIANNNAVGTTIFNQWNHLAIVRTVNTMTVYLNGTSTFSVSVSGVTFAQVGWPLQIGASGVGGSDPYTGFISNVRFVNGYAIYPFGTSRFAPSLKPLTASLTGTSMVVSGNNSGIYDSTGFNNIVTVNSATITTGVVKFGSSSMSFATGSRLLIIGNTNTNFTVGTGDFTMECWINFTSNSSAEADIFESATTNFPRILKRGSSAGLSFDYFSGALGGQLFMSDASLNSVLGSWFHLAVSRASGTLKGFVNGSQVFSVSDTTSIPIPTAQISIGSRYDGSNSLNGYISDFRFTKLARYTTSFTSATTYLPLV